MTTRKGRGLYTGEAYPAPTGLPETPPTTREYARYERGSPLPVNVRKTLGITSRTFFEPSWALRHPTTLTDTPGVTVPRRTRKGWRYK
jgi:hypothetical protein